VDCCQRMIDVASEIEKRKLRDQQIFTSITNETRLESLSMIRKIRQDLKPPGVVSSQQATPKYLNEIHNGSEMMKEIEQILQKALPKLEPKLEMKVRSTAD
jgi:maleate cis-trans isomerase